MAKTLTLFAHSSKVYSLACCKGSSHRRASDAYPSESVHMVCFSEKCSSLHVQNEKKCEGPVVTIFVHYTWFCDF